MDDNKKFKIVDNDGKVEEYSSLRSANRDYNKGLKDAKNIGLPFSKTLIGSKGTVLKNDVVDRGEKRTKFMNYPTEMLKYEQANLNDKSGDGIWPAKRHNEIETELNRRSRAQERSDRNDVLQNYFGLGLNKKAKLEEDRKRRENDVDPISKAFKKFQAEIFDLIRKNK